MRDDWLNDRMRGWFLARLELAVAAAVVLAIPILFLGQPAFMGPTPSWIGFTFVAGEAMAVFGLAWMVRIWRGPLLDRPPVWRYRESA